MVERLVRFTGRYRWPLLASWIVLLAGAGLVSMPLANLLSGGGWYVSGSQSERAAAGLEDGFVGRGATTVTLVVHDDRHTEGQAEFADRVGRVIKDVKQDPELDVSSSYGWSTSGPASRGQFVGKDRRTVIESVALGLEDGTARRILPEVQASLDERYQRQGLSVSMISPASFWGEMNTLSQEGLVKAELITLPLILLILLLLFRSVVAALVSMTVGITAIVFTLALLTPLARQYELSVFVENAATMLGLGVGVDYSLFMISRFKAELAAGRTVDAALAKTLRTSGETVVASGVTIVLAMSTLFLVPLNVIQSIALGSVVVVAFSILASVGFLPILLHLLGSRIERGRVPLPRLFRGRGGDSRGAAETSARWYSFAQRVMRRPGLYLGASLIALLAVAAPFAQLQTFTPDARIIPASSSLRTGYDLVQDQFSAGASAPVRVVAESADPLTRTPDADRLVALEDRLRALPGAVRVDSALAVLRQANPQRPLAALDAAALARLPAEAQATVRHFVSADDRRFVLEVIPGDTAASDSTRALLAAARAEAAKTSGGDLRLVVGGESAEGVDSNQVIEDNLLKVILVMLGVIYLLLLLTFRSLLLPLKAIGMNLLSVGATYGILVLVFQHGFGSELLGFEETGYLQNFVPVLLLTLLFSLSTDYEVFLLGRVREEYLASGDNTLSVARGMTRTAPLISGAAILMVAVFGAFAFTSIVPIQQLGFGMAVAIALDATIIRLVVVPAAMRLMGRWNWWMPGVRRRPLSVSAPPADRQPAEGERAHV